MRMIKAKKGYKSLLRDKHIQEEITAFLGFITFDPSTRFDRLHKERILIFKECPEKQQDFSGLYERLKK